MAEQNWGMALGVKPVDIDVGKTLKTASEIRSNQAYELNTLADSQKKMYDLSREEMGRAAKHLLMMPEGDERNKLYNGYVDDFARKGYMQPHEAQYWKGQPASNMMLQQIVANSVPIATHSTITGEAHGNQTRAGYPYQITPRGPTESLERPAQQPGAPSTVPMISGRPVPGYTTPPVVVPQPGAPQSAAPAQRGGAPQRNTTTIEADRSRSQDKVYQEVPKLPIPERPQAGPGTAVRGTDPAQIEADKKAVEFYDQKIRIPASAASEQRSNYSTLRTALDQGINTSKAGPALETISAWMNAAGLDPKFIKEWTGTDPTAADILRKATVQESMKFVRETIGARESLMAIQAITSAFPGLANTIEGNRMMVDIMDSLSQWRLDMSRYAGAFMEKNPGLNKEEQMNAFVRWWSDTHPAEQYVSRVMPRPVPRFNNNDVDFNSLQNGVTYMIPKIGADSKVEMNKNGHPVMVPSTWNDKAGTFTPKRQ